MHKTNQDGSTVWRCSVGKHNRCSVSLKSKDNQVIHEQAILSFLMEWAILQFGRFWSGRFCIAYR